jgi:iron complex transport system substrate-binding protein
MKNLLLTLLCVAASAAAQNRIISTTPSATEILFAIGAGSRVVGVTNYCHYPPQVLKLPKIGTYIQPDLERIASLKPDLVIIQKNPIRLDEQLKRLNLRTLEIAHDTVEMALASIEEIGNATGTIPKAFAITLALRVQLDAIRKESAKYPKRKIAFIVGRRPKAMEGLIAVGKKSYLSELIEIAGGTNVFGDAIAAYPSITLEDLLARDPDVIIDMGEMAETTGVTEARKREVVQLWKTKMPGLKAVKTAKVYAVADDIFVNPSPRMAEAARSFARMLRP